MQFARSNNIGNKCGKVVLENAVGESWEASLKRESSCGDRYFIGVGWQKFALDNGLIVGRRFKLEMKDHRNEVLTFKISSVNTYGNEDGDDDEKDEDGEEEEGEDMVEEDVGGGVKKKSGQQSS